MKRLLMGAALVLVGAAVYGQTAISADGVVESTSGGFKFPDGTVQASAAAPGQAPVEDTGQTQCFDEDGNARDCAGTGEDAEFQAGVTWPTPRFTDNGNGTVTDNLTGLIWLKDGNCSAGTKTWQQALDWVKNPLNSGGTACSDYTAGTFSDWRLPNVKELSSLVDYSQVGPALSPGHPLAIVSSTYWSSTTLTGITANAWAATLTDGHVFSTAKTSTRYVWAVRGGH